MSTPLLTPSLLVVVTEEDAYGHSFPIDCRGLVALHSGLSDELVPFLEGLPILS